MVRFLRAAAQVLLIMIASPALADEGASGLYLRRCHIKQFYCRNAVTRLFSTFVFSVP